VGALGNVINTQSGTENNAERLRNLQITLLHMSRDIEQAVDRPILNTSGKEEPAFMGSSRDMTFTHMGFANPIGTIARSTMERTRYEWHDGAMWRISWPALDLPPQAKSHSRLLLANVSEARFQYLDKKGRFYDNWPAEGQGKQPLPRAVRIILTIS